MVLNAENLVMRFGSARALDGIDLRLRGPGVYALLGANGAGKSTFVHCAVGLLRPSSGVLEVLGGSPRAPEVRARVGVMLQDASFPDTLTPIELLELFRSFYRDPESVDDLVERCVLGAFSRQRYGRLSGGQRRRVQLAVALVGRPELLFLDEPTAALDTETRHLLWNEVRERVRQGATVLLTTHALAEADALADQVIVLDEGKVIQAGDAATLRSRVGGSRIQCHTELSLEAIGTVPHVTRARMRGRSAEIFTTDAPTTLRHLLAQDRALADLTVHAPSLETAVEQLTLETRT